LDAYKYIITLQSIMMMRGNLMMVKSHLEMAMRVMLGMVMSHTLMDCTMMMMAIGGHMMSTPVSAMILAIVDHQLSSTGWTGVKSPHLGLRRRMPPMMMRRMMSLTRKNMTTVSHHTNKGDDCQQVV
jgi:hypothetical protein